MTLCQMPFSPCLSRLRKFPLPSRRMGCMRLALPTWEPLTCEVHRPQSHEATGRWRAHGMPKLCKQTWLLFLRGK